MSSPLPLPRDDADLEKYPLGDAESMSVESISEFDAFLAPKARVNGLIASHPLPPPKLPLWWLTLRYGVFSTYRCIFALVTIANSIAVACMIAQALHDPGSFTILDAATAVSANLFVGTLFRHEHYINLIFRVCVAVPLWMPLSIRRRAAKVYSYGGVHSGCGVSSLMWYIFFAVLVVNGFELNRTRYTILLILTCFLLLLLATMIVSSHPKIRSRWHDLWELNHRYSAWAAVVLVWAQFWILVSIEAEQQERNASLVAIQTASFWFLVGITLFTIYPWLRLRRVEVDVERLSDDAARLRFPKHQCKISACKGVKLSRNSLRDNHSFATIADPDNGSGYSILVSRSGDWTRMLINQPPKYLWIRGAPTIGVMRIAQLFNRVIVVGTGSGIGPCLSFMQTHPEWPCRVIWSTRLPVATTGQETFRAVLKADKDAIIIDNHGVPYGERAKLSEVAYAAYKEYNAEAVVIISNPRATKEVVFALESRNVPAFGAIFDS